MEENWYFVIPTRLGLKLEDWSETLDRISYNIDFYWSVYMFPTEIGISSQIFHL